MNLAPVAATLQDCWNQIGVQGDASCPRLAEVSHCRNCPVYSTAAARLLHGLPPAEYLAEWTERLAQPPAAVEAAQTHSVLLFRLGANWLALSAACFQEVAEPRPVHTLPHRRGKIVQGLVNIRGELVICVSLGDVLSVDEGSPATPLETSKRTVYARLLVVGTPGGRLAFPASEVHGIEGFAPGALRPVPETLALASARYTRGILPWRGLSVGCLDDHALFSTLNRSLG